VQTRLTMEEAQSLLLHSIQPLQSEVVTLLEAPGRVLAEDILAPHDLPAYPQAAMDGFAIPEDGLAENDFILKGSLQAGEVPSFTLAAGETAGVLTGGHLPGGTAAVIKQEDALIKGEQVFFQRTAKKGSNIRQQGEDFRSGEVIARKGTEISPGLTAVLAAFGFHEVKVIRRPRVAILSLGKEVVPYHQSPLPGQVRDSNGPLLASLSKYTGGEITGLHALCTSPEQQIRELLSEADLLLTIGGTSSGNNDPGYHIMEPAGITPLFSEYQVKPGSHTCAGIFDGKLIIMLSGNPVACAVGYHLLAAPVIRALKGLNPELLRLPAVTTNVFPKKGGPRRFLLGYALCSQQGWRVAVLPFQKPSMRSALIAYNCLLDLPAGHPPVQLGDQVTIIPVKNS